MDSKVTHASHDAQHVQNETNTFTKFCAWVELVPKIASERRKLQTLDERTLKDIGLDRGQVEAETSRSIFDVPNDRL